MPYEIKKMSDQKDGEFCVMKKDGGIVKCHPTMEEAKKHMAAMYANVPDAAKTLRYRKVKAIKSISDAPNLRDRYQAACCNCKFFQDIERETMTVGGVGICTQFDFAAKPDWTCDAYEVAPDPMMAMMDMQGMDASKTLIAFGDSVKTIKRNGSQVTVGGYLVRFSDANDTDLTGDFFAPDTDFGDAQETKTWFHHTLPIKTKSGLKRFDKPLPIGTLMKDDFGIFMKSVLDEADEYQAFVLNLIDTGKIGLSSGTADHLIRKTKTTNGAYHIDRWLLGHDASYDHTPADPNNLVQSLKSLKTFELESVPDAAEGEAITVTEGANSTATQNVKTIISEVKMTDEEKRLADEQVVKLKEQGDKLVALEGNLKTATEQIAVLTETLKKEKPAASGVQVEPAQKYPYKSFVKSAQGKIVDATGYGEFLQDVVAGSSGTRSVSARLSNWTEMNMKSMKAATGLNVTVPSQGGFFVQTDHATELVYMMIDQDDILNRLRKIPLGPNADGITINGVDETSRASTIWGGILAYWLAEASTITASKPKFREIRLEVKGLEALYWATDKILRVAPALGAEVATGFREAMSFKLRDSIVNGSGSGKPLGLLNSGSIVSVAKETNQTAATILTENVSKMKSRLFPSSFKNAVWLANMDTQSQWDQLAFTIGAAGVLSPYVRYTDDGVLTVHGKPVIFTEHCATLGTTGDVILWSPDSYYFIDLGAIEEASSIHVNFTTAETAFRFLYYCDGQPKLASALTPAHGTNTLTTHVKLDTRS